MFISNQIRWKEIKCVSHLKHGRSLQLAHVYVLLVRPEQVKVKQVMGQIGHGSN